MHSIAIKTRKPKMPNFNTSNSMVDPLFAVDSIDDLNSINQSVSSFVDTGTLLKNVNQSKKFLKGGKFDTKRVLNLSISNSCASSASGEQNKDEHFNLTYSGRSGMNIVSPIKRDTKIISPLDFTPENGFLSPRVTHQTSFRHEPLRNT